MSLSIHNLLFYITSLYESLRLIFFLTFKLSHHLNALKRGLQTIMNNLPDQVLVNILSLLPTKVAVSTSILSKQWEFLWMWLPKLEYSTRSYSNSQCDKLLGFLHKNLPLHRAPVIDSLVLDVTNDSHIKPQDIKMWVLTTISRVRELDISYASNINDLEMLPSNLYISKSLVTLKLYGKILVDVPRPVSLPCLKTLKLHNVTYFSKDSLRRLLSNCLILEELLVDGYRGDNMGKLIVIVPSLRKLEIDVTNDLDEFVINTPLLELLKIKYRNDYSHYCLIENMPKLMEADVEVIFPYFKPLIGSITSVKSLRLCLWGESLEVVNGDGFVFNNLDHLMICVCQENLASNLLRMIKDSPNLRVLDLCEMEDHWRSDMYLWNKPSIVPTCMLFSLQTFKWSGYLGRPQERDLAIYFLQNSSHLKTATILSQPGSVPTSPEMLKELAFSSRASTKCQLIFD